MLDQVTPKGRILAAALECAGKKSWADVTLLDIAEAATLPLHELRGLFVSKTDIIAALLRAVDDEVLSKAPARSEGQEKRDRLFDIVMTRFDVLGPYKAALKSIHASGGADFALAVPYLSSQHWMLQEAGSCSGMRKVAPGTRSASEVSQLASASSTTETPKCLAIAPKVSPGRTTYDW